ncbi:putative disease resistance protein At3g14460 [Lycium ferocissimum]|uniref:putative disease resistance protein At3g14460 n=1 Tax=Lycium ferocissimum TaxID=112874 RepID=UPI002815CBA5|nr:putative disease resistance protein At3g14460 [Lycium ferocissimum]
MTWHLVFPGKHVFSWRTIGKADCTRIARRLAIFHAFVVTSKYDVFRKFEMLSDMKHLRTFLPLAPLQGAEFCYLTKKVLSDILPKLSCLRVLSLSYYCITEIPESIGCLKHLRFINFSYTEIKCLPQSFSNLYNLQTLLLHNCDYLIELPADMGKLLNLRYLDVSGSGIRKIPLGLDKLVCLRTLPEFVVGSNISSITTLPEFTVGTNSSGISDQEDKGSGIGALRNLLHLEGSLSILNLENVDDVWDAHRASLITKKHLTELLLQWSNGFEDSEKARMATDVLELLRPHRNIEKVTINGYSGTQLPTWIGNHSFYKLVSLSLSDCRGCRILPSLGQLPSLKNLMVKGLSEIKSIGDEFFGHNSTTLTPFASLETLTFTEMLEWEDWLFDCDGDMEAFSNLLELHLEECPKLRGKLPDVLPCLVKLVIYECQQLDSSLPRLPQLHELELRRCNIRLISSPCEVTKLASLQLYNISNEYLPESFLQNLTTVERLIISDCCELVHLSRNKNELQYLTSLRRLVIRNCDLLGSLFEEGQKLPHGLEYVELDSCHNLLKLPSLLHTLASLEEVLITDCPRLESFAGKIFPSNLKGLAIQGCSLESLPESMMNRISSLKYLSVYGCLMLTSFPRDSELLPTTFQQLTIEKCPNLEFLPEGMMHSSNTSLQVLEIFDCSSISSFPGGQLPKTLKTLTVWNCFNLEALPDIRTETMLLESLRVGNCTNLKHLPHGLHKLLNLNYLEVDGCHGIEFFPQGGLPQNLTKVLILDSENLKFLPKWMKNLTSLEELQLSNCPSITSFPEGGLPTNLVSLDVKDCKNLMPMSEWGLHRLASLRRLTIHGISSNLSTFPEWLLPSTLETLDVVQLSNLESLSPWMQNLTSLENLKVKDCRKVLSLPKEGVPPMLSYLEISGCPLLEQNCEWSKIDHIPCIVM